MQQTVIVSLYVNGNAKNGCFVVKRYAVRETEKWRYAVRNAEIGRYAVRKGGGGVTLSYTLFLQCRHCPNKRGQIRLPDAGQLIWVNFWFVIFCFWCICFIYGYYVLSAKLTVLIPLACIPPRDLRLLVFFWDKLSGTHHSYYLLSLLVVYNGSITRVL